MNKPATTTVAACILPGERRPFQLEQPFTVEEVVGLADKMKGRRRAALLAYAQLLQLVATNVEGKA